MARPYEPPTTTTTTPSDNEDLIGGPLPQIGASGETVMGPRAATGYQPGGRYADIRRFPGKAYLSGAQYKQVELPVEQFQKWYEGQTAILGTLSPGALLNLQNNLSAIGLLGDNYAEGAPDEPTKDAFGELLQIANEWEVSWQQALTRLSSGTTPGRMKERGYRFNPDTGKYERVADKFVPDAFSPVIPNKLDVDRVMRSASIDLLGQGWSQQNVDAASNSYIAEVTRLQKEAYDQKVQRAEEIFNTGASNIKQINDVQAPSQEAFAEEQIKKKQPQQMMENSGMEMLLNMVQQWGGNG